MPNYNSLISRTDAQVLIPETTAAEIIQEIPTQSAVLKLGNRQPNMPSKTVKQPLLDLYPDAYFVAGDTGMKQTTKQGWSSQTMTAEEIAVIVVVPENVLDDSNYPIWDQVRPRLSEAAGKLIDKAILYGTNKPASWPDGIVTQAVAAGNVVDFSVQTAASKKLYDMLLGEGGLYALVEEDGFTPNGAVASIKTRARLRGLLDTTGQPIFKTTMQDATRYELEGLPVEFPNNGAFDDTASHFIVGDFTKLVYSFRQDMTMKIFTEGVITDDDGKVIINLMQQDSVALRAVMRLGWQLINPKTLVNPTNASRSPFAVLVP